MSRKRKLTFQNLDFFKDNRSDVERKIELGFISVVLLFKEYGYLSSPLLLITLRSILKHFLGNLYIYTAFYDAVLLCKPALKKSSPEKDKHCSENSKLVCFVDLRCCYRSLRTTACFHQRRCISPNILFFIFFLKIPSQRVESDANSKACCFYDTVFSFSFR